MVRATTAVIQLCVIFTILTVRTVSSQDANPTAGGDIVRFFDQMAIGQVSPWSYSDPTLTWDDQSHNISVCWDTPGNNAGKGWVETAVTREYHTYTNIRFTGWRSCTQNLTNIRITISDEHSRVTDFGKRLNNVRRGMILNFTFQNWAQTCATASLLRNCIESIAVHEFGHAIGLYHEQNRLDTFRPNSSNTCSDAPQSETPPLNSFSLGPWDPSSIMNYCNPIYNNNGELSAIDIEAINILYKGTINPSVHDWGITGDPQQMADVNGDGKLDFCRIIWNGTAKYIACQLNLGRTLDPTDDYGFKSVPGLDLGHRVLPRYFRDVNGDGAADYCRFVGSQQDIYFSCILADKNNKKFSDINYDFNSDKGIDPGHLQLPRMMADVNNDRRNDYCRFVGNPNSLRLSCMLAKLGGFGRQYEFSSSVGIDPGRFDLPRTLLDIGTTTIARDGRADFCRYVGTAPNIALHCNRAGPSGFGDGVLGLQVQPPQAEWYNQP